MAVIVKVNPKTLRVKFDLEWMNALNITKVPYDALSQKCKEVASSPNYELARLNRL